MVRDPRQEIGDETMETLWQFSGENRMRMMKKSEKKYVCLANFQTTLYLFHRFFHGFRSYLCLEETQKTLTSSYFAFATSVSFTGEKMADLSYKHLAALNCCLAP